MARGIRQFGAIAGSAALAGSMVFGLGGATAAAQTQGTGSQGGTQFERTVDKSTVEVGDEVEVTSTISKDGINAWLVYWMKDLHPECFEYVDGFATWTVSNQTYTQESNPEEVTVTARAVEIDPPRVNSWARPIVMKSRYTVTCGPGPVNSGGLEWNTTNAISGHATFDDVGPMITVEKASSSVSLGTIGVAQTGVRKTLNIFATKIPDGQTVAIYDGDTEIGQGSVDSTGPATVEWTPTAPGPVVITAEYSGDATTAASTGTANVTVEAEPTGPTDPTDPDGSGTGSLSGGSLAALLGMGFAGSLTGSLSGS